MREALIAGSLVLAMCMPSPLLAAPPVGEQTTPRGAGLTDAEFEAAVRRAMPLPVLQILRWKELGRDCHAVEMSLASIPGASSPAMHVTFHTGENADGATQLEAIQAAAAYARGFVRKLTEGAQVW
jgi:hypothetical protein